MSNISLPSRQFIVHPYPTIVLALSLCRLRPLRVLPLGLPSDHRWQMGCLLPERLQPRRLQVRSQSLGCKIRTKTHFNMFASEVAQNVSGATKTLNDITRPEHTSLSTLACFAAGAGTATRGRTTTSVILARELNANSKTSTSSAFVQTMHSRTTSKSIGIMSLRVCRGKGRRGGHEKVDDENDVTRDEISILEKKKKEKEKKERGREINEDKPHSFKPNNFHLSIS
jgi:hypothetical protein